MFLQLKKALRDIFIPKRFFVSFIKLTKQADPAVLLILMSNLTTSDNYTAAIENEYNNQYRSLRWQ